MLLSEDLHYYKKEKYLKIVFDSFGSSLRLNLYQIFSNRSSIFW